MWADAWARYALTLSFIVTQQCSAAQSYVDADDDDDDLDGGCWSPPPNSLHGVGTLRTASIDPCASAFTATNYTDMGSFLLDPVVAEQMKCSKQTPPTFRPLNAKSTLTNLSLDLNYDDRFSHKHHTCDLHD